MIGSSVTRRADSFLYAAVRTPFGRFGGALAEDGALGPRRLASAKAT